MAEESTEEKKEEEQKQEPVSPDAAPASELSLVERAEAAAKTLIAERKKTEEVLAKNENAVAKLILGGRSAAGQAQQPKRTDEEVAKEEAKLFVKQAGFPEIFK